MGSPVVAIIALVLGYTGLYAGIKNVSLLSVIKGTPVAAASTSPSEPSDAQITTQTSNQISGDLAAAGTLAHQQPNQVMANTQPVGTPRKAS